MEPIIKKNLLINLAIVILSLVFSFAAGEFFLKAIEKTPGVPYEQDDILMIKAKPGTDWTGQNDGYVWDNNGFRNAEVPERAEIVMMGDSMVLGLRAGREEAWPQVLEQLSGKSVYQIGQCQYSIPQYYYLLDKALELDPETIIISFYVGNDLFDAYNLVYTKDYWRGFRNPEMGEDRLDEYSKIGEQNAKIKEAVGLGIDTDSWRYKLLLVRSWIRGHSRMYKLLGDGTRGMREKIGLAQTREEIEMNVQRLGENNPALGIYYDKAPIETLLSPQYRREAFDLDNAIAKEGYEILKKMLLEMNEKIKAKDIRLIMAIVPSKELIYEEYMKKNGEEIPAELEAVSDETRLLVKSMEAFFDENKILYHELTADMTEALAQKIKIFPETIDSHPNANGYGVMAESVDKYLKKIDDSGN